MPPEESDPARQSSPADGNDETEWPDDETVVETASDAAEGLVFDRYKQSEVRDLDVTVTFEGGRLEVDVYLHAPESTVDPERVADDAALAAQTAVDELFEDRS
ncbi:DUF3194 domain-containing protein [Halovivax limisalsi]|uniref:DUF3194 domain-containing protein n=1 Tax=Halovivax limisalsi TaxID=1453760 RepID=UPI001FFDE164|nr:DUF3194 domain-containing protein [Halovivax limisalsi]